MSPEEAIPLSRELLSLWQKERRRYDKIDRWARWAHDDPHKPRHATAEYRELSARAQAPWGDLVVGSVAQTLYVEGYRRPSDPRDGEPWTIWQANGMDARQIALHRAALTYGLAYGVCLPGKTLSGAPMPTMRGVSPREMIAVYEDPAHDDWPRYALRVVKYKRRIELWLFDNTELHRLTLGSMGDIPAHAGIEDGIQVHDAGVCPVVRYKNRFDLEGRAVGEIEPFIPLLGRIDQTVFDRLVVQRFASWIVRTIAGMSVTESADATGQSVETVKALLSAADFLTAEDADTKFGSLPATPMNGFNESHDSDLRDLAAVSQTPAFELLGQMANLSAEALAAAKSSQTAKSDERKHTLGEDHEQFIRLACHVAGDTAGAEDFEAQVRWADTSIRSLAQAADAYGKMATMLGVPPQGLWAKIPGVTQQDVDEWKKLVESQPGGMDALQALLAGATAPAPAPTPTP